MSIAYQNQFTLSFLSRIPFLSAQGTSPCYFLSISFQLDIDECKGSKKVCDDNAYCSNTVGSYNCTCKEGFTGDGHSCSGKKKNFKNNTEVQYLILLPTEIYRM